MTKSILSEQREADEALCDRLADMSYLMAHGERATDFVAIDWAAHRIRALSEALSEALQEACHERDGLLAVVERMGWNPSETAPSGPRVLARGRWMPLPAPPGEKRWGAP